MVEPQSPLAVISHVLLRRLREYIPEVRDDLVTTVGLLLVLLRSALGDLELVCVINTVGAVGAATDLTTVCAVAENLRLGQLPESSHQGTYVRSLPTLHPPRSGRFRTCILRGPYLLL